MKQGTPSLTVADLLDAVPLRSQAVRVEQRGGQTVFHVPLERRWYMGPPLGWLMPFSRDRTLSLDRLGMEVWEACDGRKTVEQIVEQFAAAHHLRFHEARLSVMEFLKQLTQRGLIAVVGLPQAETGGGKKAGAAAAPDGSAKSGEGR